MFLKKIAGIFFLFGFVLSAQQIKIIIPSPDLTAELFRIKGETAIVIDTVSATGKEFRFSMKGRPRGFYRLQLGDKSFVNFINDGEDVELKRDKNNYPNTVVIKSESNKLYYKFVELNKAYKKKTELLNVILRYYPKGDGYYSTTLNRLKQLQAEYLSFVNIISQKDTSSFVARYIRSAKLPIVDGTLPIEKQIEYFKHHALDNVDFNDEELIYSDLFTSKVIEYLTYYKNPNLPKQLLEQEFQKAVDTLLYKSRTNRLVYQQITEYLIKGFTEFGFDAIINYIVDNYVIKDGLEINAELKSSIRKRINQAKHFKIGNKVPNIILPDTSGKIIDISKINTDKILILFYASWCPHCKKNLPALVNLYNNQKKKKIEVVAVSIDTEKKDWVKVIREYKMNFINLSDLKGWDGKAAINYYIYATPTMFLIDNRMRVLSKPLTIDDVKKIFEQGNS